jgi:phosphatidylethanolamine/phosphatidyl-N-methylethanolamine N-methyltransferase
VEEAHGVHTMNWSSEMRDEDKAWVEYREKFADVYDESNYSSPLQARVMRAGHAMAEKPFDSGTHFTRVMEIGAGTGEHLSFVRHGFDQYILTDLDPKTLERAKRKLGDRYQGRVEFATQTGDGLDYPDNSFDRLIASHVLEHIYQPHLALREWERVIKPGGTLSILIPTDPGIAWRLGRHLGPRRNAIARGIAYDYVMAREHVNSCNNLIAILRHYFPHATEAWWPLPVPSIDLNLFFSFNAVIDKREK